MKKLITLFGVIWMLMGTAFAQNCNFKVKFKVTPASCYNNGKVHYALVDADDNPILSPAIMGLDSVRIYYKISESDSAHYNRYYPGGWDSLIIDYGSYIIGVEGICNCGTGCFTKVDTHLLMDIPTTYHTPVVESFSNIATTDNGATTSLGMRPTINCMNTGRVQLKIMDGRFPFTVDIKDRTTGVTLRIDTLFYRQYSGTNPLSYDYRDYYSFDSLPAGSWEFHVEDGCGYKLPIHTQQVTVVEFPKFDKIEYAYISADENSYADVPGNQVIRTYVHVNNTNKDYTSYRYTYNYQYFPKLVEYRLKYGEGKYTEWKPAPVPNSYAFYLYDTLPNVTYCELIGRTITFEYRDNCWDTTITKNYLFRPNFTHYSSSPTVSLGCTYDHGTQYHQTYPNYIYHEGIRTTMYSSQYEPFYGTLVWVWTDTVTNTIIKTDTIPYIQNTYLFDTLVERLYRSFENEPLTLGIRLELKSENCGTLFTVNRTITFSKDNRKAYWNHYYSYQSNGHCCKNERYVNVYSSYYEPSKIDYDSTIVRLVRSPKNNLYNFEAIYDAHTNGWRRITKDHLENPATITTNTAGTNFEIRDNCLPSGVYEWEIITPCDTYHLTRQVSFPDLYEPYFVEEPSYTIEEECTRAYINYTAGKVAFHRYNTSYRTGNDTTVLDYFPAQTYFKVISCPAGGADLNLHTINDPINISMPGRYIVKYYTSMGSDSAKFFCEPICDTIDYAPASTVSFDYAIALKCDPVSTHGTIYVGGRNGTEPYTYTLYRNADKEGPVLGTNLTGIFEDIEMGNNDEFSCSVQDMCGASFYINLKPKTWTELQKVWFDGGTAVTTTCEGSTICVNAISIGSILSYEWSGPDGFTDTVSRSCVFIPRDGQEGWYKVHIYHSGCIDDYYDSIYLNIDRSPWVTLSATDTVCPGSPTEVNIVPHSPNITDNISMTVVFENIHETITRNFSISPGDTAKYTISPLTQTKIYATAINDGTCDYAIADDTLLIEVYTINPYTVTTLHDTVCYESTANLSTYSSLTPPYAIRWYNDYDHTDLVKEDSIYTTSGSSSMVLPDLTEDKIFYIVVENDEYCPTTYGKPTHIMNMCDGETELSLGHTYRFYDSGGPLANYGTNERLTHTFSSTDGKPVTIRFESFSLNSNAHLYIFSGPDVNPDSMLCDLTYGSPNPGTIVSRGGDLTCYFVSWNSRQTGWNALVEHEPAKAIAKVLPNNKVIIYDTVCQSQSGTYSDTLHITPYITSIESLNDVLRVSGTHTFSNVLTGAGRYGCDSTVIFMLTVTHAPYHDTTVVITNVLHNGYFWHDSTYTTPGIHTFNIPLGSGCDSLDILQLIILDIDTTADTTCLGTPIDLTISANIRIAEDEPGGNMPYIINNNVCVGDVLCDDGTTMNPDEFLTSDKKAMGVVLDVDAEAGYGRAIALSGAYNTYTNGTQMKWCHSGYSSINSITQTADLFVAMMDMNGSENTSFIVAKARRQNIEANLLSTAAYHCLYYDHNNFTTGNDSLGWYMPSGGEMLLVFANRAELNNTLKKLRTSNNNITILPNGLHWTSTEDTNINNAWTVNQEGAFRRYDKWGNYYVRPLIKFQLP